MNAEDDSHVRQRQRTIQGAVVVAAGLARMAVRAALDGVAGNEAAPIPASEEETQEIPEGGSDFTYAGAPTNEVSA